MTGPISRRELLARIAVATVAGTVATVTPAAEDDASSHRVDPADANAVALGYVEDATRVDASRFKSYRPGQSCASCSQIQGAAGAEWRPCLLFPDKLVKAAGWCSAYVR